MTIEIKTDKNGKQRAYREIDGKKVRIPLYVALAEQSQESTDREESATQDLVVEAETKQVQPLLLTYQQVPDYNEVSNVQQRGLMQYPEFAFDVLKQIPREFEQGITELPEIPFHERIVFEQAQWLHEDIADLDRKSRVLVYNYTELASEFSEVEEFMIDEVLSSSEVESEDVPLELLHRGMQATQCQQWQSQDHRCVTDKWNCLCDYDAETERELLDLMVARQERDQLDNDKYQIYNCLDKLWSEGKRFTADSAYDLFASIGMDFFDRGLVEEVAKDVLSVVQPRQNNVML